MNKIVISYLITASNETDTLKRLFNLMSLVLEKELVEVVVLIDSNCQNNETTIDIIKSHESKLPNCRILYHALDNNYSNHKNWGMAQCKGEYIWQIDGDECPTNDLIGNIHDIINENPTIEAFWIPRINNFIGVTDIDAKKWGWILAPSKSLTESRAMYTDEYEYTFLKNNGLIIKENAGYLLNNRNYVMITYKAVIINPYDYQCRLFQNKPEIQWKSRLHERIVGNKNYVFIPDMDETLALIHTKSIQKQNETNTRYNTMFTEEENTGFILPNKKYA